MSWQASAWAKTTRGFKRWPNCKLLLMILADYHNDESGTAWPTQATLSADCEMPMRTIQRCLTQLQKMGLISVVRKGNQYQPTIYSLNLAGAQIQAPATSGPANMASASEPAISNKVNPPSRTSEPAISLRSSKQEPPVEPPIPPAAAHARWLEILAVDPRWPKVSLNGYVKDIEQSYGDLDLTVEAHKAYEWLQTPPKGPKKRNLKSFWLNWLKKELKSARDPPRVVGQLGTRSSSAGEESWQAKEQRRKDEGIRRAEERKREPDGIGTS